MLLMVVMVNLITLNDAGDDRHLQSNTLFIRVLWRNIPKTETWLTLSLDEVFSAFAWSSSLKLDGRENMIFPEKIIITEAQPLVRF